MDRVLVLDQSYVPISVVSFKRAMSYVAREKVEVLRQYEKIICSAHSSWRIPAVIRLMIKFNRPRKIVKFSRNNVYARDRFHCQYCRQKFDSCELTYDHVIPKSRPNTPGTCWENIVTCCKDCNMKKGNKTPQEANMPLWHHPIRPDWVKVFLINTSKEFGNIPEQWKEFCYVS